MNKIVLLSFLLFKSFVSFGQQYDFIPTDLKPVPLVELKKPSTPLDLVFYEDGTKVVFKEAMKKIQEERATPTLFADESGTYKALVINEKIQIDYPGMPENLKRMGHSFGNPESDLVIIYSQGGPFSKLSNWKWQKGMLSLDEEFEDSFFINSMQTQILKSVKFFTIKE